MKLDLHVIQPTQKPECGGLCGICGSYVDAAGIAYFRVEAVFSTLFSLSAGLSHDVELPIHTSIETRKHPTSLRV